ncbi:MAG: hypothetical protein PGN26_14535 [Xylophilus ampelinus]
MPSYLHPDVLDGGPLALKSAAVKARLVKTYAFGDAFATVTAASNVLATVDMGASDITISADGTGRKNVSGTKSGAASGNSNQYDAGTATGGSTTTLADTSKSWVTNAHANRAVTIVSGTGAGQSGRIASNTATALTITKAWAVAPDATSVYRISDDLHWIIDDNSAKVLAAYDETTNQPVTSGNTVNFPALTNNWPQPA